MGGHASEANPKAGENQGMRKRFLLETGGDDADNEGESGGRGLHSSTFQLNVISFRGKRWVLYFPPVY